MYLLDASTFLEICVIRMMNQNQLRRMETWIVIVFYCSNPLYKLPLNYSLLRCCNHERSRLKEEINGGKNHLHIWMKRNIFVYSCQ